MIGRQINEKNMTSIIHRKDLKSSVSLVVG